MNHDVQLELFGTNVPEVRGATFSECGRFRFALWRTWDQFKSSVMFIGLNPSTANASTDDPTIRRVRSFAKDNGFGGFYMLNLFPFITAYPEQIVIEAMFENDEFLRHHSSICNGQVVFAWGAFKMARDRASEVIAMFPDAKCLGRNMDGSPKHPLYIPATASLIPFNQPA